MNFQNTKFKAVYNPLSSQSANGQWTIKVDNNVETPVAVVPVALGNKEKVHRLAKENAQRIVDCLNYCSDLDFSEE